MCVRQDALCHSPVLVQGFAKQGEVETLYLSFPFPDQDNDDFFDFDSTADQTAAGTSNGQGECLDGEHTGPVVDASTASAGPIPRNRPAGKDFELAAQLRRLPQVQKLKECLDIKHNIGFITIIRQSAAQVSENDAASATLTSIAPGTRWQLCPYMSQTRILIVYSNGWFVYTWI